MSNIQNTSNLNSDVEKIPSKHGKPVKEIEYDDPFEFSNSRKWMITISAALLTLTATFCSSIFSATIVVTAREFKTSETVMLLGVSLYVLGFALGPLLWGPLSELLGRRIPLFTGFFLFAIMQIPTALVKSLAGVLICRLLSGCFGAAPVALVSAMYADYWDPAGRGIATALYSVAAYAGPTLGESHELTTDELVLNSYSGPIVGSFVTESHLGWRWTAWLILIMAGFFGPLAFFIVPETYGPVLKERAMRKEGTDATVRRNPFDGFVTKYLSRPMQMLLSEGMVRHQLVSKLSAANRCSSMS